MVFPAVGSTAIRETILLLAVDDNISNDISASYYNKYRQKSRTVSPAFFPPLAANTHATTRRTKLLLLFRCWLYSNLQHSLQARAGGLFVLVEGVGIDIQRGGGLTVAEDARHRCHIRAARDHQTGGGVSEGMNIQLLR